MNYEQARRRMKDGKWHWTNLNDGKVYPSGGCAQDCPGHDSREEAERHQYEYELNNLAEIALQPIEGAVDGRHQCVVCGAGTLQALQITGHCLRLVPLCAAHCNRAGYALAHPFQPGRSFAHS
jgi:hypothetical protein